MHDTPSAASSSPPPPLGGHRTPKPALRSLSAALRAAWRALWHRECDRRLTQVRAQHENRLAKLRTQHATQVKQMRTSFAAKRIASSLRGDARIAEYAAQARRRIEEAQSAVSSIDAEVQKRVSHATRIAALAAAAERRRERDQAFEDGRQQGLIEGRQQVRYLLTELEQASTTTACGKIRLNDEAHAQEMARHVFETRGVRTEPYPCKICPRQLFGRGRFWHVRTINDPAEKALRDKIRRGGKREPGRIALRLPPEQIKIMKERARPAPDSDDVEQPSGSADHNPSPAHEQ